MGNTFGQIFRITTFGESHGAALGVIIDGCPPGIPIDISFIQQELDRRRPGQSKIVTQRKEGDEVKILSGVFEGVTTGTPIGMVIENTDQKSKDYGHIADKFRPSHADNTYFEKYGVRDYRGGGRSSARETAARVAAGALAKLVLKKLGVKIEACVTQVGAIKCLNWKELDITKAEESIVRCPDTTVAEKMIELIQEVRKAGDSIGGVVSCIIRDCPPGLGQPVFEKFHATLASAMLGINAAKGFQYGSGFSGVEMRGSEHNDEIYNDSGRIRTKTNHAGGVQGGITNGEDIYFDVAFKPVATIMMDQTSINEAGEEVTVSGRGRHDPCVVPRAVPIVEAMAALVTVDFYLRNLSVNLPSS